MRSLNLIDIETPWGFRTFELQQGDITQLESIDVLAISAFKGKYDPTPGTVVCSLLENCKIDLRQLSRQREFDLVETFGCWVAKVAPGAKFKRIVCAEMVGNNLDLKEIIENLFAVLAMLEMKGIKPKSLALPILGAGQQQLSPSLVIKEILNCSLRYIHHSTSIKRIVFVELREERAHQLDTAMNDVLGRVRVVMPRGELYESTRASILQSIEAARDFMELGDSQLLNDARRVLNSVQVRSFEMGMISRRLLEFIVRDLLRRKVGNDLCGKIEALAEKHVAEWIRSYMHVLRVFGNESAHEKEKSTRRPPIVTEADMGLCLLCLERVLDSWLTLKNLDRQI